MATGAIDESGVHLGGNTWTWDEFNAVDPARQKEILGMLGLSDQQTTQVLGTLQKAEMEQYKQYKELQAGKGQASGLALAAATMPDLPFHKWLGEHLPGARSWSPQTADEIQQGAGLPDLVKKITSDNTLNQTLGQAQQNPATGSFPAYTQQALNNYTQNYVVPQMQAAMGMVNQDMGAWKANIDKIAGSTGMSNSPVTELVKQNQAQQQYLANAMMPWMMAAQNMVPYTNLVNQTVSEQATQGVRQQALGSQIGNILSYGLIDPTVAQALNQSITNAGITNAAALGGLGQAGVQSLLATQPGLANLPGVTTAIPGQSG